MFVVKLTGCTGVVCWQSAPNAEGFRSLATRDPADVLQTAEEAHSAIAKMPRAFEDAGLIFSVEFVD